MAIMLSSSKSQPESLILILAVVVTILLSLVPPSSAGFPLVTYHAHIVNELKPNNVLYVRCHCSDHDLGDQYINVNSEFEWNFRSHWFRSTIWQCYLAPDNNRHAYFKVFSGSMSSLIMDKKYNFYWVAKDDGVYMRDTEHNTDNYAHPWQANP
ncbi:S-protein homolog 74 [Linum perenne]